MLAEIGLLLLGLMGIAYLIGIVICTWTLLWCAVKGYGAESGMSLLYGAGITISSIICGLPFLKMHGNFSDIDRLLIIALIILNLALIVILCKSRFIKVKQLYAETN